VKIKRTFLAVAILIAVPALGQEVEHAPTVAQCQADQRLWLSKLEADHGLDDVTFSTLVGWGTEMVQCEIVDPQNHLKYSQTNSEDIAERATRELNFISRHGLGQQFLAEDAAGKR
jgi:aldehyde:ferredoxin oxidoreductase